MSTNRGDASGTRSARCVFVGNIPYDATEEQLIEIFQEVGPVVSFRLVFDRDTGKPKGYGFCEYRDAETALSAMRNLNNHDFNGRPLRVDFADNEKAQMQQLANASNAARAGTQGTRPSSLPQAPMNAPSVPETVNSMLDGMNPSQMYDIVAKMKGMIQQNPEQAKHILMSNPPLTYALLQAQAILGMVNIQVVQKLCSTKAVVTQPQPIPSSVAPTTSQPIPTTMPLPSGALLPTPPAPIASNVPYGTSTTPYSSQPQPIKGQQVGYVTPPQPIYPNQVPSLSVQLESLPEPQRSLLQQVVNLTPDQIDKLPPEQRQQVQQLRQTLAVMTGVNVR